MNSEDSLVAVFLAVLLSAATGGVAAADSPGFTQGDAEAVFNARHLGGSPILLHSPVAEGAPADLGSRIGPGANYSGARLCSTDWHVINVFPAEGGDSSFTRDDAVAVLEPLEFHWTLDGVPIESMETPVKAATDAESIGLEREYYLANGYILAPDELAVGQHTSHLVVDNWFGPGISLDFGDVVFHVDPPVRQLAGREASIRWPKSTTRSRPKRATPSSEGSVKVSLIFPGAPSRVCLGIRPSRGRGAVIAPGT